MSGLYTDSDWSQHDLQGPIGRAQAAVSKSQLGMLSAERLQYYCGELKRRAGEGQAVSFLDLWGLIIEYLIHGEVRRGGCPALAHSPTHPWHQTGCPGSITHTLTPGISQSQGALAHSHTHTPGISQSKGRVCQYLSLSCALNSSAQKLNHNNENTHTYRLPLRKY